jgi:protein-disulfide isomerase
MMIDIMVFVFKDKGLIIGIIVTIILVGGGVLLMTGGNSGSVATTSSSGTKVNSDILIPKGDYETGGIENGNYLPASGSAKVTLVEFGDYECPACGDYEPFVKQLLTDFAGKMNFVFRNYPLSQHSNAQISSDAAEAAGLQGKFWQMHDKLYENQNDWSNSSDPTSIFVGYAQSLGLDVNKFESDIASAAVKNKVQSDTNDGNTVGLTETPTFYLNGVKIKNLTGNYTDLRNLVSAQLNK